MMSDKGIEGTKDAEQLLLLIDNAQRILIKKLSNNDRDWARLTNKHQAGVYMPKEHRDGGFFPNLQLKNRPNNDGDEIREVFFKTIWPQLGEVEKNTRLVHYTSKGQETHMTGVPKEAFENLSPASFLIIGKLETKSEPAYLCLTIDSSSEEAIFLGDLYNLAPGFLIEEFKPETIKIAERERILDFAEQVINAWLEGKLRKFATENATMPITSDLAKMALNQFLKNHNLKKIDPFSLNAPGDVLRELSRDIEWNFFREYQRRERSVALVRLIVGDEKRKLSEREIIRRLIDKYQEVDAIMLSASQQRKARAGYSYEYHIEAMLIGGDIPFEKQVIIQAKKRPDFILPSLKFLNDHQGEAAEGLILSAKTTLRERWKQVEVEKKGHRLFLTTVDENIAGNAIEDMASLGIQLVIPESLMESKATEYSGHNNVISFKTFCEEHLKPNVESWKK